MSKLLQQFFFTINKGAPTNSQKYPELVGQSFLMNLVTEDNEVFTAEVTFNFAINSLILSVYKGNNLIQANTVITPYPTNLLICEQLIDYLLIFDDLNNVFNFYKVDKYYNSNNLNYYQMLERFKNREIL